MPHPKPLDQDHQNPAVRAIPGADSALSVGQRLRHRREERGWEIAELGAVLRIKPEYLRALEQNDFKSLPGTTYAIGFLRAYAAYLGLDPAAAIAAYKRQSAGIAQEPELSFPMPLTPRGIPGARQIILGLILLALGYGAWVWYGMSPVRMAADIEPVPVALLTPPPAPEPPAATDAAKPAPADAPAVATAPVAAPAATPLPAAPTPTTAPPTSPMPASASDTAAGGSAAPGQVFGTPVDGTVMVRATGDSWVEVLDNDHRIWSRLLRSGDVYYPPKTGLVLRTGNAGGLEILVGGKLLPPVGAAGEVKRVALDADKVQGG